MKLGDLIYDSHYEERGLVVSVEPSVEGEWCTILYENGETVEGIRTWEETIEVISESR